ncbi:unnamed protein product [Rotaria sordida]|uniref:Uncharacterized protein n=1 Tax=Rotaria sordida TaxID=392033 RepID=A0A818IY78_9BILA|nr:unnamed protein product [Rotaria sordida]CAF3532128.1 unnamed protein product [Rotaria sordida]
MITEGDVICADTIVIDYVVDRWPSENSLANIYHQTKIGGGSPFNIIKDSRSMDKNLLLSISVHNLLYTKIAQLMLSYIDHLILNEIEIDLILKQSFQQGTISQIAQAVRILIENYDVQRTITIHFDQGTV